MPKISVIVPVYNIADYLPRFFESMLKQTFTDYQIIIANDGSLDDSLRICNDFAKKDSRIIVLDLEHGGVVWARRNALEIVTTEYTVFADGDDYVEPEYLEHLFAAAQKYSADLVISRVLYRNEGADEIIGSFSEFGEQFIDKSEFEKWLPTLLDKSRLNYLYGKIYKTDYLKECIVADDVKLGEDTMQNCQYVLKIKNIVLIDNPDYNYIKYSSRSITSYSGEDLFYRFLRVNDAVSDIFEKAGYLSDEMMFVIDKRILLSAIWTIEKILNYCDTKKEKINQIDAIFQNERYRKTFKRANEVENIQDKLGFIPIKPQRGAVYLKGIYRQKRILYIKSFILSICPNFIKNIRAERREKKHE